MPDELDDLDDPTETLPETERRPLHAVSDDDSTRYGGIAAATIRRRRSAWTEIDGQTAEELWMRLCRHASRRGPLADEDARVFCRRVFHFAQLDALKVIEGRGRTRPLFEQPGDLQPAMLDPQRRWVLDHLDVLTAQQRHVVVLALDGLSLRGIEMVLGLAAGSARPLMVRAQRTLKRELKKGPRDV